MLLVSHQARVQCSLIKKSKLKMSLVKLQVYERKGHNVPSLYNFLISASRWPSTFWESTISPSQSNELDTPALRTRVQQHSKSVLLFRACNDADLAYAVLTWRFFSDTKLNQCCMSANLSSSLHRSLRVNPAL